MMKFVVFKSPKVWYKVILVLTVCFNCIFGSCSEIENEPVSYGSIEEEWLYKLTSTELYGRKTGTEGCQKAADFIFQELVEMGHTPYKEEFMFRESILMSNIIVEIPGNNDSIVIIGAHYDGAVHSSKHQAANDNASGIVTLLSIAKSVREHNNTILLCFWDGEESTNGTAFNGSRYFVEHFEYLDRVKWYCNIDCCGSGVDPIYLYYSSELEKTFNDEIDLTGYPLDIIEKIQEQRSSDYVSFKNKDIPFWGWNDTNILKYIHTSKDSVSKISISKIQMISHITIDLLKNKL